MLISDIIKLQRILFGVEDITLVHKEQAKTVAQRFLRFNGKTLAQQLHGTPSSFDWAFELIE